MNKDVIKETMEWINFEGLLDLSLEQQGIRYTIENSDVLLLWHMTQRRVVRNNHDDLVRFLMKSGYDSIKSLEMVKRFKMVEKDLGHYNFRTQSRLDNTNSILNPSIHFEQVDDKHLGVIRNKDSFDVLDISTGKQIKVAVIKEGINWLSPNFTPKQMMWIKNSFNTLKSPNQGRIV